MDFVTDALADWRQFRCFTLVDDLTRECPAIEVSASLPAFRVIQVLDRLVVTRGLTRSIVSDNGPEFASRSLDLWAHHHGVALQFIRPGKPVENTFIESFNGRFREECLSTEWFTSITHAQQMIEAGGGTTTRLGRTVASLVEPPPSLQESSKRTTIHPNDSQPE